MSDDTARSESKGEKSSLESAFPRGFADFAMVTGGMVTETGRLAGTIGGPLLEDPLITVDVGVGAGFSVAESDSPARAVARCNCSKKPGAPLAPGGGVSGAAPVVENPAPTEEEANTAAEIALVPPKPDA